MTKKYNLDDTGVEWIEELPLEEWIALGNQLASIERRRMFWIGDWVNYGEAKYGEKYSQALSHTDYAYNTLRKASYVMGKVPKHMRRAKLNFEQHAVVAPLPPKQMKEVLDKAEKNGHTIQETKELVAHVTGKPLPKPREFTDWWTTWVKDEWDEQEPTGDVTMSVQTLQDRMSVAWFAARSR